MFQSMCNRFQCQQTSFTAETLPEYVRIKFLNVLYQILITVILIFRRRTAHILFVKLYFQFRITG